MSGEVLDMSAHRASKRREGLRKDLIITFKNPLLRLKKEQLEQVRQALAKALLTNQASAEELRLKWQLLHEVLNDSV